MMDKRFNHKEVEKKWIEFWERERVYAYNESDFERETFSIDTPPPFTSGSLHMGHVLSYSYFDFVARYKRMKGYNVFYPQGWDTQGFPTEVKVEQKYGRNLSREQFIAYCKQWTEEMIRRMKEEMKALGFSADWRYEYRTMDADYHEKVQRSLIEMYEKGEIYRARHPVLWCPHCKSAIAKAETEDKERVAFLNYVNFYDEEGNPLTIATTRPELIPAAVALLFNPEDERYKHLEGKHAITPFNATIPIIADKDVDKEFGTGLMMVATFGDKADVVWMYRHKLPMKIIINEEGKFVPPAPDWMVGLSVEQGREKMVEWLKEHGHLVKREQKHQVVKVHDRCKTPVELIPSYQWFAKVKDKKGKIIEWAKQIQWFPAFGIHYLIDWTEHLDWDWVISRNRVFGTPLPFYVCEHCGHIEPADALPFYPERAPDKVCPKCGKVMKKEDTVADCWVDSSITPLVIAGWPRLDERKYPASLRPQGVEIVRTWAFYTIYRSGMLTGKAPFKHILLNGNVLAPDGRKMSKSLGNVISPRELLEEFPADAIRQWAAMSGAMAKDRPFSYEDIRFAKLFLTKFWNSSRFIQLMAPEDVEEASNLHLFDKWILAELNALIKHFDEFMERYEFHHAIAQFHHFFWHRFCDHYIEMAKPRIYGDHDKRAAQFTLRYVLYKSLKLFAPFAPFITEEVYYQVFGAKEGKSIHLTAWPEVDERWQLSEEEKVLMQEVLSVIEAVRKFKAQHRMSMKAGLKEVVVQTQHHYTDEVVNDLKTLLNIENLVFKQGAFEVVSIQGNHVD